MRKLETKYPVTWTCVKVPDFLIKKLIMTRLFSELQIADKCMAPNCGSGRPQLP